MNFSSIWTRYQKKLATRSSRKKQRTPQIGVEAMEPRELLAATALFLPASGELSLDLDSSESVRISSVGGNVVVETALNGSMNYTTVTSVGTIPSASIVSINVLGGDDANTIDLSRVLAVDFTSLTSIVVDGANGHDLLIGSPDFGDSLIGGNGDDTIRSQGGNDTIVGGDGDDSILAGTGDDSISAGDGDDSVFGEDGNDTINAGNGQDTVSGGNGNDSVEGQNGQDSLLGDADDDTINGDGGTDTIDGGAGNDLVIGGEFNDFLVGGLGNDTLNGNSGNDTLIGVTGADKADGGAGNDLIQSALDLPTDDPVPAAAVIASAFPRPFPLPDAVDSTQGINLGRLSHTIGTGTADGGLTVQVTSTGAFGSGSFPNSVSAGASFNPLGPIGPGDTTFDSEVYFRASTVAGSRDTLAALATNRSAIRGSSSEANSTFDVGALHFTLTQLAEPVLDLVTGLPVGSLLTQTYRITNTGTATSNFELARYLDGRLRFDGSFTDGGGRLVSTAGDEFLFETDAGGLPSTTNYVGITAKGGTIPAMNRFEIDQVPALQTSLQSGQALDEQVFNDTNGDQSTDVNYDVSLGLRNTFSLAANASAIYTTHTLFGTGMPNQMQLNQKPVAVADVGRALAGSDVAIDLVSNDFDVDGSLDYSSIQFSQSPTFGTVLPLGDGRVLYTPAPGFSGTDTFTYTIADNLGARSGPAIVTVTVNAVDSLGDTLNGGLGNDTIIGSDGNDTILGGSGQDSLLGGQGEDRIQGQGGNDTILGGGDDDHSDGGDGNDLLLNNVPIVVASDLNVTEGNSGTTFAVFTVTLSRPALEVVTVNFLTLDGTATAGSDYVSTSGQVQFAIGETSKTILVTIIGDTVTEYNESISLRLSNSVNAVIGTPRATANIVNDDGPVLNTLVPNVNVSRLPFNQAEVTLTVNPVNPLNLIASANNLDDATNNEFTFSSQDGGLTWTQSVVPNAPPPTANDTIVGGGDPTIVFDRNGVAYFAHLTIVRTPIANSTNFTQILRNETVRSFDGGLTWTSPTALVSPAPVIAMNVNFTASVDKVFMTVGPDRTDPTVDRLYLAYQQNGVQFIQSSLDGVIWNPAVRVQDFNAMATPTFIPGINAQPAVGPNGQVYLVWQEINRATPGVPGITATPGQSRIMFDVSLDGGVTWGVDRAIYTTTVAAFNDPVPGAAQPQQYTVPAAPVRGMGSFLAIDVDRTGANPGNIYVSVLDQSDLDGDPLTNHDDTDVFLIRSTDAGASFSTPVRVNDDNSGNSQFIPWLDVDQVTGNVAVGWYDARNDLGVGSTSDTDARANTDVEFFATVSADGGLSFAPNVRFSAGSSNSDTAAPVSASRNFQRFDYGEYVGIAFTNGLLSAAWSDNSNSTRDNPGPNGAQDLYSARTTLIPPNTAPILMPPTALIVDGNDTMSGAAGNDTIFGGAGNDLINGGAGDDSLSGLGGDDSILGGAGNDTLDGGAGDDTLDGQGGDDLLIGGGGNDTFVLGNGAGGNDTVDGGGGFNQITVTGTGGADNIVVKEVSGSIVVIRGNATITAGTNMTVQGVVVNALGGNDTVTIQDLSGVQCAVLLTVNGGDGNDLITGQGSNIGVVRVALNGDNGNDTIIGTNGTDSIDGGAGNDAVNGQAGNDLINGGDGDDVLAGGLGNDTVNGGNGNDFITGQEGDDSLSGNAGNDTIRGFEGNDTLKGLAGDDLLNGMDGDDSIEGGVGKDSITGGSGDDTLDGGRNDDQINGNSGNDKIRGDHGNDFIHAGTESDTVNGGDGHDTIIATDGGDFLAGGDGNDRINSGAGDDIVTGGDGNDTLLGGSGNDILLGGDGDDVIDGQGGACDTVAGNQGIDVIADRPEEINEQFVLSAAIMTLLEAM